MKNQWQMKEAMELARLKNVSIPLRGIGYEKQSVSGSYHLPVIRVSIPLRGIGYEKLSRD